MASPIFYLGVSFFLISIYALLLVFFLLLIFYPSFCWVCVNFFQDKSLIKYFFILIYENYILICWKKKGFNFRKTGFNFKKSLYKFKYMKFNYPNSPLWGFGYIHIFHSIIISPLLGFLFCFLKLFHTFCLFCFSYCKPEGLILL